MRPGLPALRRRVQKDGRERLSHLIAGHYQAGMVGNIKVAARAQPGRRAAAPAG